MQIVRRFWCMVHFNESPLSLQIKETRADMQQEVKEKLVNVASVVSKKISAFRALMSMLKTDVHTQLAHVHEDQAHTIKRTLYRLETVRASSFPHAMLPYLWQYQCASPVSCPALCPALCFSEQRNDGSGSGFS